MYWVKLHKLTFFLSDLEETVSLTVAAVEGVLSGAVVLCNVQSNINIVYYIHTCTLTLDVASSVFRRLDSKKLYNTCKCCTKHTY